MWHRAGLGAEPRCHARVPEPGRRRDLTTAKHGLRRHQRNDVRVGRDHPLRPSALRFFAGAIADARPLATSSEVLQELAHAYLPVERTAVLFAALRLVEQTQMEVWPLERDDVLLGIELAGLYPALGARDLCHLASCQRRGVTRIRTFDPALRAAAGRPG